ncbi:hypothetical protein BDQ12DRAFT_680949 [Crucibulum laeve]|uniref:Uncharacterized protein n=1 Tax=Crucibulum laeve TaxID=68775 RepID=A0A5C3M7N6_9AGAR|nr:hypothetical protein BDQ12DRAFT_680949 [Crucibulum laeve]
MCASKLDELRVVPYRCFERCLGREYRSRHIRRLMEDAVFLLPALYVPLVGGGFTLNSLELVNCLRRYITNSKTPPVIALVQE